MQKKNENSELPLVYRLLLKIPMPNFFNWLGRRSWIIGLAIYSLVITGVFCLGFIPFLMLVLYPLVGFPVNVILGGVPVILVIIFWFRIQIERIYNYLNLIQRSGEYKEKNLRKIIEEYIVLCQANLSQNEP